MRYAQIRNMDISNGEGIGVSLFVQGCHFHCDGCFNKETWDFKGGKLWTIEHEEQLIELIDNPHISRVSILGGEPLAKENIDGIRNIVSDIRLFYGTSKKIWLYTGYKFEDIYKEDCSGKYTPLDDLIRSQIVGLCDVLVDGRYDKDCPADYTHPWFGSMNQRLIDVQKTMGKGHIVEYIPS